MLEDYIPASEEEIKQRIELEEKEFLTILKKYSKKEIIMETLSILKHLYAKKVFWETPKTIDELIKETNNQYDFLIPHYIICSAISLKEEEGLNLDNFGWKNILGKARKISFLILYLRDKKHLKLKVAFKDRELIFWKNEIQNSQFSKFYLKMARKDMLYTEIPLPEYMIEPYTILSKYSKPGVIDRIGFKPHWVFGFLLLYWDCATNHLKSEKEPLANDLLGLILCAQKDTIEEKVKGMENKQKENTWNELILTSAIAEKFLVALKNGLKEVDDDTIFSLPLWDYPLIGVENKLLSSPCILVESSWELFERIKRKDKYTNEEIGRRKHLAFLVSLSEFLEKKGYIVHKNIELKGTEIDILASKQNNFLHLECKTFILQWRHRIFASSDKELNDRYPEFLKKKRIDMDSWRDKCYEIDEYVTKNHSTAKSILHFVVTDYPAPIPNQHTEPKIIWIEDFEEELKTIEGDLK